MSRRAVRDAQIDLTRLPYLTRRRAAIVADCHESQIAKHLTPIGRRGRAYVYATSDVLAFAAGRLAPRATTPTTIEPQHATSAAPCEPEHARDERPLAPVIPIFPTRWPNEPGRTHDETRTDEPDPRRAS